MASPPYENDIQVAREAPLRPHVVSGMACGLLGPMYCVGMMACKTTELILPGQDQCADLPDSLALAVIIATLPLTFSLGLALVAPGALGGVTYYVVHRIQLKWHHRPEDRQKLKTE